MPRRSKAEIERARRRSEAAHAARILRVYGISKEEYDAIYEHQGGLCAICRRATGATRRLSVDHDHESGLVRGLLCRVCNNLLGHVRDDPRALRRAISYLRTPPAKVVLGERIVPAGPRRPVERHADKYAEAPEGSGG